jgi:Skp family chaperone for outer membrane proteins
MFALPLLGLALSAPVMAQQPAPAAQPLGGPQVTGVCLLSQQAVMANAKVGVAATARLKQLTQQAQSEVGTARAPIEADAKALESQRASMKPADFQAKAQALQARLQTLQQTAQARGQQIELTRQKVLGQIANAAQPVIAQVYKAHGCGLLVDRNAVLGGNMGGDLTPAVVQGLDAKMTTISFDLAPLPAQTASAAR